MTSDTARFLASASVVMCVISLILLAASGCREFPVYLAIVGVAIFAAFVASTQDA